MVAKGNTGFKFHISVCSAWLRKQNGYGVGVGKGWKGWGAGWELLLYFEATSKALPLHVDVADVWWRWWWGVLHRSVSYQERPDYVCQAAERKTRVGVGTKHVWVTLAGFQEGLNLGFHNLSLGTCRDS